MSSLVLLLLLFSGRVRAKDDTSNSTSTANDSTLEITAQGPQTDETLNLNPRVLQP